MSTDETTPLPANDSVPPAPESPIEETTAYPAAADSAETHAQTTASPVQEAPTTPLPTSEEPASSAPYGQSGYGSAPYASAPADQTPPQPSYAQRPTEEAPSDAPQTGQSPYGQAYTAPTPGAQQSPYASPAQGASEQPYGQTPYGQAPYSQPYGAAPASYGYGYSQPNALADRLRSNSTICLVLGILGLIVFPLVTSIPAWIWGNSLLNEARANGLPEDLVANAKLGKLLGIIGTAIWGIGAILLVLFLGFVIVLAMTAGGMV